MDTQAWLDLGTEMSAGEYLKLHPEALTSLYTLAFPVFDNHTYVEWFRQAGFDGAVHGGWGASNCETEYRVFDASQVISGAPMPAVPHTMLSTMPLALVERPRLSASFEGALAEGRQFTLDGQHAAQENSLRVGAGAMVSASRFAPEDSLPVALFSGRALTPAGVARLAKDDATPAALRRFLRMQRMAIAGGEPVEAVLQRHVEQLELVLQRGAAAPGTEPIDAKQSGQLKAELGWFINHGHKLAQGCVPRDQACLRWDASITEQPQIVRDALSELGFDGYYEVHNGSFSETFLSRIEAEAELRHQGQGATLVEDFPAGYPIPTGQKVYAALAAAVGGAEQASRLLAGAGVIGVRHPKGQGYVAFGAADTTEKARIQVGQNAPSIQSRLGDVPGLVRTGSPAQARQQFVDTARLAMDAAQARVALLKQRSDWLRRLSNHGHDIATVEQRNSGALRDANAYLQQVQGWRLTEGNTMTWDQPLAQPVIARLHALLPVTQAERLTGRAVFDLLANRLGSNAKACEALAGVGINGAYTAEQTVLWDKRSELLAQQVPGVLDPSSRFSQAVRAEEGAEHAVQPASTEKRVQLRLGA